MSRLFSLLAINITNTKNHGFGTRVENFMGKIPIFMYHHVSEPPQDVLPNRMWVSPVYFKKQMYFLNQKGFRCISLSEAVTTWQEMKHPPRRSFILTFDDGFTNFYENALPILNEVGFCAVLFVVVQRVESGNKRYLSWQTIREISQYNIIIGSHTLTHPKLSNLDEMSIKRELRDSKKIIEDRLGLPVDLLAYPYGESNELIQDIACNAGYRAACGVDKGQLKLFNLWRVPISDSESRPSLLWKANGGYYTYTWLLERTYFGRKMREFKRSRIEKK